MQKGDKFSALLGTISWSVLVITIITFIVHSNNIVTDQLGSGMKLFIAILLMSTFVCFVLSSVGAAMAIKQYNRKIIVKSRYLFLLILNTSYLIVFIAILIFYLIAVFQAMMGI